jgi:hypothetical protein
MLSKIHDYNHGEYNSSSMQEQLIILSLSYISVNCTYVSYSEIYWLSKTEKYVFFNVNSHILRYLKKSEGKTNCLIKYNRRIIITIYSYYQIMIKHFY